MMEQRVFDVCISAVLIVAGLTCADAKLQCYECNSHNDDRCFDEKLPSSMLKYCDDQMNGSKYNLCRKISQEIEFKMNGMPPEIRVIRGCGWDESHYKGRCYERGGYGGTQVICSCEGSSCNSASGMKSLPFFHVGIPISLLGMLRKCTL